MIIFLFWPLWVFLILPWGVKMIVHRLPHSWAQYSVPVGVVLFLFLLPLPLIDETIGGIQLRRLCARERFSFVMDKEKARGRAVYLNSQPRVKAPYTMITIWDNPFEYRDAKTGEVIAIAHLFSAEGGLFSPLRPMGPTPFLLHYESCSPQQEINKIFEFLQIKQTTNPKYITF